MTSMVPPPEPGFHPGGTAEGDFWVFAYGSLMWQPGFPYMEMQPGTVRGYHRSACILSIRYRGTPEVPGLVLGMDRGGACRGRAYLVDGAHRAEVVAYLDNRELVTGVYKRRNLACTLDDGRRVAAYCFVADPDHRQYAGRYTTAEKVAIIRQGEGLKGRSRDYIAETLAQLEDLGIHDGQLSALLRVVDHEERVGGALGD